MRAIVFQRFTSFMRFKIHKYLHTMIHLEYLNNAIQVATTTVELLFPKNDILL